MRTTESFAHPDTSEAYTVSAVLQRGEALLLVHQRATRTR